MNTIKITIVDDDKLLVNLMRDYLDGFAEFHVQRVFYGGRPFIDHTRKGNLPDILLLDYRMKDGNGKEVIDYLNVTHPDVKVILLSSFYQPDYLSQMFKLGVSAFLPKEIEKEDLILVIKQVDKTGFYFDKDQMEILRSQINVPIGELPNTEVEILTQEEQDVLGLLSQELTGSQIADRLLVNENIVESHMTSMFSKTGAKNRAGLIIYAANNKMPIIPSRSKEDEEWLSKLKLQLINQLSNNRYSISQLAYDIAISERQLRRRIKQLSGMTPSKYLKEIRLQRARELLEQRQFNTIAQTASAVGFLDSGAFSRNFTKRFGKKPSEYLT